MRSKMALKIYAISKQKSSPTNWTALIMSAFYTTGQSIKDLICEARLVRVLKSINPNE
jgi:hypothetical protein